MIVGTLSSVVKAFKTIKAMRPSRVLLRKIATVSFALLLGPAVNFSASNVASAQNQMQLNKEACDEFKKSDAEMNAVYLRIRRDYRQNREFIAALKQAQLAWIRFRDAHLASLFPGDASQYGSINTMCRCTNLAEITKARTQVLNQWVEGIEEGDVCAGSVKTK